MFSDDSLYGFCACHCSLLAHEGGEGTQAVASEASKVPEDSGANVVLDLKLVHDNKVLLLLVPHFLWGSGMRNGNKRRGKMDIGAPG